MDEQQTTTKRDESLGADSIDEQYLSQMVLKEWQRGTVQRREYLDRKQEFESTWRSLIGSKSRLPWENASNFHVPLTLTYGKAVHAKFWQLFSSQTGFFRVKARREDNQERETTIENFMNWVWETQMNGQNGAKGELDLFLWDLVFVGSGYLKCYWKKTELEYLDVQPETRLKTELVFSQENLTGVEETKAHVEEVEVERTDVIETPEMRRVLHEDVMLPVGYHDPQDAPWAMTRLYYTDEMLKEELAKKKFFQDAVEEALKMTKDNIYLQSDHSGEIKAQRIETDGYTVEAGQGATEHIVIEYIGPAYVLAGKVNTTEFDQDPKRRKRQIVAWVHARTQRVLGWTYLSRISANGKKPLFKADYMTFPERVDGVGVSEVLYDTQLQTDAIYNMRNDNGQLAMMPMFKYRNSSMSLKPTTMRIKPGQGIPVDDINDLGIFQFPLMTGFGYQEEAQLTNYTEKMLALSEINLGRAPDKVGALRNATGSNLLASESNIQLQIHFDRIARCMNGVLDYIFCLCRERMPEGLFFRVTGKRGQPVFGTVDRRALRGDYDFETMLDILGQSKLERQQAATLRANTFLNPVYLQTGIVQPGNIYNIGADLLRAYGTDRIDDYLTPPQNYEGPAVSPTDRISRILAGFIENPPVEDTVRLNENHEAALAIYDSFKQDPIYGHFEPMQVAALERVIQKHQQMLAAQNAPGNPNSGGQQMARGGFQGGEPPASLTPQVAGEANGPVL